MVDPEVDVALDVVVVGAGPTGLMLAGELGRAGVRTLLVERRPRPSEVAKAGGLAGHVLDLLHYRGDEPVNVAMFFAATVGVQWLILIAALGWWVLRRVTGVLEDFHPLRSLLSGAMWLLSAGLRRLLRV